MVQYYTLDEAARILQTTPEEVRKLADEKKLRYFRDKGTLRFRAQEIDELARQMGLGSDPELPLGDVPSPRKGNTPPPRPNSPAPKSKTPAPKSATPPPKGSTPPPKSSSPAPRSSMPVPRSGTPAPGKKKSKVEIPKDEEDIFDFTLDEEPSHKGTPTPSSGGKSGGRKSSLSPPPKPGSDSDVRLVDQSSDAEVILPLQEELPPPAPPAPPKRRSKVSKVAPDSGVRLVPSEPDSDVKMVLDHSGPDDAVVLGGSKQKSASDSDIRLEQLSGGKGRESDSSMVTEEIDLDAEMARQSTPTPPPRPRPSSPALPTGSPFELSEDDLEGDRPAAAGAKPPAGMSDSSGDFELVPSGEDLSPLELGSDEMPAVQTDDDEVPIGEMSDVAGGSGINLKDPSDSGISLEQEAAGDEFELTLDDDSTPVPSRSAPDDSDSEFELTLDDSDESESVEADSSEFELSLDDSDQSESAEADSSEFELSLDDDSGSSELELESAGEASDSEFELTLDDSAESSPSEADVDEERDIFETDFEVPALEEESGSEAVSLDDDEDSSEASDFDLALDDMDVGAEEESGSAVVALDDEDEDVVEVDEDGEPIAPRRKTRVAVEDDYEEVLDDEGNPEFEGIGPGLDEEDEELTEVAGGVRVEYTDRPVAPWGPVPVVLMVPCMLVLFVVGIMSFELIQGMINYQKTGRVSGLLLAPITKQITGQDLPGVK